MSIRIRKQSSSWVLIVVLGAILAAGVYMSYHHFAARAFGFGWVSEDPTATVHESTLAYEPAKHCVEQDVFIGNTATTQDKVCVYQANGWRYGIYKKWINEGWRSYWDRSFVISVGGDSRMYRVEGLNDTEPPLYIPNSSDLVYTETTGYQSKNLWIIKDLLRNLIRYTAPDFSIRYRVKDDAKEFLLKNEQGLPVSMVSAEASINGRWLAVEVRSAGLVIFDMRNYTFRYVSKYQPTYGTGKDAQMLFSISDDGSYFAYAGIAVDPHVMELTPGCGTQSEVFRQEWRGSSEGIAIPCPERRIWQLVNDAAGGDTNIITAPFFNYDGGQLTVYAEAYTRPDDTSAKFKWITLTAAGYAPVEVEYLALGDSYSSGEGDTEINPVTGKKYYLPNTDIEGLVDDGAVIVPREKCHVSTRAFPFLIGKDAFHAPRVTRSVACSGARVSDDFVRRGDDYRGGASGEIPRLSGIEPVQLKALRAQAISDFIPGRVEQLRFVDKYKPRFVTLTGSGNDALFGEVIKACVQPAVCGYASEENGRRKVGEAINQQFDKLVQLYGEISKASTSTKIIAVGYPQFVSAGQNNCAPNAQLDVVERTMIRQSVAYMNDVIEAAAKRAGVGYINIENAFGDNILCGTDNSYVTGLTRSGRYTNGIEDWFSQESYHPNARGHQRIAEVILNSFPNKSPYDYSYCETDPDARLCPDSDVSKPMIPEFFKNTNTDVLYVPLRTMTGTYVTKNPDAKVRASIRDVAPGSSVTFMARSNPTELGVFSANQEGELEVEIDLPQQLGAGVHTLEAYITTSSGESKILWQPFYVLGANGDSDENGIEDQEQGCVGVPDSGQDSDRDSVDDACDPEITKPPTPQQPLYRARYGDTVRPGEKSEDLVIERSIETAVAKQMPVDADQDADGWAVVGKSNAWTVPGNIANFTFVDDKPALSVRTDNLGCVRYRPMSLNVVEIDQVRNLAYEAINTNTCRSQSLESDMDANGLPDNTQPLYRARNGDPGAGERANVVYLERSRAAAESQLGLSDYTPLVNGNLQSWNLIAKTILPTTYGTYKKLLMVNDKPVILVEGAGRKCITLAPLDDGVIRRSLQPYMPLIKQPKLSQGQNCG